MFLRNHISPRCDYSLRRRLRNTDFDLCICNINLPTNVCFADPEPDGRARIPSLQATGRREPLRGRQRPLFSSVSSGTANQQRVAENLVRLSQRSHANVRRSDVRRRR